MKVIAKNGEQGYIMPPTLFAIYTNGMPIQDYVTYWYKYADDMVQT